MPSSKVRRLLGWIAAVSLLASPSFATTYATFDTDSAALNGGVLSNGNLTVVAGTAASTFTNSGIAQATEGKSSGKYHVEFTCVVNGGNVIDVVGLVSSWGLSWGYIGKYQGGGTLPSSGIGYASNGNIAYAGGVLGNVNGVAFTNGAVIAMDIDLDNKRVWWQKVGTGVYIGTSGTPNPATNTGGFDLTALMSSSRVYPAVSMSSSVASWTVNFGATAFSGTVPSGFTSGWPVTLGTHFGTFATTGTATSAGNANVGVPGTANDAKVSAWTSNFTGPLDHFIIGFSGSSLWDLKGVVYDATGAGGLPGALLGVSSNIIASGGSSTLGFGEQTFNFTGVNLVSGTSYWFGAVSDRAQGATNAIIPLTLASGLVNKANSYASPSNPFGASPTTASGRIPTLIFEGASAACTLTLMGAGPC